MKFRIVSLLVFLSSSAFLHSSALGMKDDQPHSSSVPSKPREVLTEERRSLKKFLRLQDYPKAFVSLRAELPPTVLDQDIIKYLITSNRYKKSWDALGEEDQGWISTKITNQVQKIELDDFISKQDYASAFNAIRKVVREDLPDEEIAKFLLESNGYKKWSELSEPNKIAVTKRIATQAQKLELKDILSKQDYPKAFKSLRETLPTTVANEEIVKFLLESNGYEKWNKLIRISRKWVVAEVTRKFCQDLEILISLGSISKSFRDNLLLIVREMISDGDKRPVPEILQQVLHIHGHRKVWDKLGKAGQQYLVDLVLKKVAASDFEGLKEVKLHKKRFILKEKGVPRDGDCGYVAMGFEGREAGVQFLLPHIHRPEIRELIAPEIYDMLSQLPPSNPIVTHEEARRLFEEQHITDFAYQRVCQELNDALGLTDGFRENGERLFEMCNLSTDPLIQPLHQILSDVRQRMAELELAKLNYCRQEETVGKYIKTFMQVAALDYHKRHDDPNWLNFSPIRSIDGKYRTYVMNALAFLQKKNLIIVDDEGRIKHAYKYDEGLEFLPANTTFLLHTDDFGWGCTHFNKLIPLDTFIDKPLL
ncbi:MAG: hypothetical protein JSR85_08785 [Proteobacteria bacterium]|nr:hypothetical protein [Pseudomonadota bacterium]